MKELDDLFRLGVAEIKTAISSGASDRGDRVRLGLDIIDAVITGYSHEIQNCISNKQERE